MKLIGFKSVKTNQSGAGKNKSVRAFFFSNLYVAFRSLLNYLSLLIGLKNSFSRRNKVSIKSDTSASDEQRRKKNISQIGNDTKLKKKSLF